MATGRRSATVRVGALAVAATLAGGCAGMQGRSTRESGYRHFVVGNPADVVRPTRGLWVLQGGGDDVDENYVRMGRAAGGGDFVVLRASGDDAYNDYVYRLCGCDSVATIVFHGRAAASDPFVIETIRNAEAVFIAGGDQSRYVRFWQDTPVEDAINAVAAKPAPVGGTSAGMAILGEFVYSAMSDRSLTSEVALADPYARDVTLTRDFLRLPGLENILTDQHVLERDRIGRTVALLARIQADGWSATPRAIAADRKTSVHIDPALGSASVFATQEHDTPHAYFLKTGGPPMWCRPNEPLSTGSISVFRLAPQGRFDLKTWSGHGGLAYEIRAESGTLHSTLGKIY